MISYQAFFKEKFEYDLHSNLGWLKFLEENEDDLSDDNLKELSKWMSLSHHQCSSYLERSIDSKNIRIRSLGFASSLLF